MTVTRTRVPSRSDLNLKPLVGTKPRSAYAVDVGARIWELAEWRGLTRMKLAGKAGLHVNAIAKVVTGESDMRLSSLVAIADALEVPICELLP